MKTIDRRALAKDLQRGGAIFDDLGSLPSAKELTIAAASFDRLKQTVREAQVSHSHDPDVIDGTGTLFSLNAASAAKIHLPYRFADGGTKIMPVEIRQGQQLGFLRTKVTSSFPNSLIDELLKMQGSGSTQRQMHEHMAGFYRRMYDRPIPTWYEVAHTSQAPQSADENAFLIFVGSDLPVKGVGVTDRIIPAALGWYRQNRPDMKYALAYTRMTNLRQTLKREFDMYSEGYPPATAEEAQQYLERNAKGEQPDWSIDFHRRLAQKYGGTLLLALPGIGREDHDSLYAGTLGLYDLKNPKKQFI